MSASHWTWYRLALQIQGGKEKDYWGMTELCGTQGQNRHKARFQHHLGRPLQCIVLSTVSRTFQIELVGYMYVYVDSVGLFLNPPG